MAKVTGLPIELSAGATYAGVINAVPDGTGGGVVRMYRKTRPTDIGFRRCANGVYSAVDLAWTKLPPDWFDAWLAIAEMLRMIVYDLFRRETADGCINDEYNNNSYDRLRYG